MPADEQPVSFSRAPIAVLGVCFDNITTAETLAHVDEIVASRRPHYAATANVDFIVQALEDIELRRILFDAHLVMADGQPVVWASRFLGNALPERVTGSGLIPLLLEKAEQKGWRVFFLGGREESLTAAVAKTRARHPRLQLVGAYSPPFRPLLEMDHADILRRLQEAQPDILLVAFGCPKQEKWIWMNYAKAEVPFSVGVGATIDFLAGTFKRAPQWMQQAGLEWVYRLLQEPRRLLGRYGKDLWVFGGAILRQWQCLRPRTGCTSAMEPTIMASRNLNLSVARAPEHLNVAAVETCREEWGRALERGGLVVDLGATVRADSTGVGLLIRLRKQARELNRAFALAAPQEQVIKALRMMKLEEFFTIKGNVAEAETAVAADRGEAVVASLDGEERVILWQGEATAATVGHLAAQTEEALQLAASGDVAFIDLRQLTFTDSSGVGLMIRLQKECRKRNITLRYRNPTAAVRNVLRMTQLEAYLLEGNKN